MNIREVIMETFLDVSKTTGSSLVEPLTDDTVLLQCGLDSLGFATVVAQLEERLQFDPFTMTDEAIYPRTVGDFVGFYEKMFEKR